MKKFTVFLCSILLVLVAFSISNVWASLITSNILDDPTVIDFSQFNSVNYYGVSGPVQVGDLVSTDVTITADPAESGKGLW